MQQLPANPTLSSSSDEELRDLARSMAAEALVNLLPEFVSDLRDAETLDEKRKGLVFLMELSGSKAPVQREEKDDLPLINITIGRNMQVKATGLGGETQTLEFSADEVTDAMRSMQYVNEDLVLDV